MRIKCPHCGERSNEEFAYHGAALARPSSGASEAEWVNYVYLRDNPAGILKELWYHASGCHAWLMVTRDTLTHEIHAVEIAKDVAVARGAP